MLYELVERNNLDRHWHSRLVLLADMFITLFASVCAVTFISVLTQHAYPARYAMLWLGSAFIGSLVVFLSLRTNSSLLRHSTLREVGNLVLSIFLKEVFIGLIVLSMHLRVGFSFPHLFALLCVDLLFSLALLVLDRIFVVVCYDVMRQRAQRRRKSPEVMVYGTDEQSVSFAQLQVLNPRYHVAGFLVYAEVDPHIRMADKRIFRFFDETSFMQVVDLNAVDAIVFTSRQQMNDEEDRLVRYCHQNNIRILLAPPVENMSESDGTQNNQVREVSIEDLLGRPEICIDTEAAMRQFSGKVIMITGAAGSIGSELCMQLASFGVKQMVLFDSAETPMHNLKLELQERMPGQYFHAVIGDVRFRHKLDAAFRQYRPQVVFHAAAYKHVPLMEENPCEAVHSNVIGTQNVADKCLEYGVEKMVMISTDKAVNPTNIMGCSKRLAEIYVQSMAQAIQEGNLKGKTRFVTTRFGNVLGSNGSVIPRFREQIAKGGPITVTHPEITRFFMTIPEACRLVIEAATMGIDNKIFIFDMGESVKIADMARRMIELAGYVPDKDIRIEYTGLRPGEKLYEEVLATSENTIPTEHQSIRVAKVREYDYFHVAQKLDQLCQMCREMDESNMVRLMKHVVPEFKSQNSKFEKYDLEIEEEIMRHPNPLKPARQKGKIFISSSKHA